MKVLGFYQKLTDFVFFLLDVFCRAAVVSMTLLVVLQIVLRTVLHTNIAWAEEVVLLIMVWMTFAAMAIGIKEEVHIRIDFFMSKFSSRVKKYVVLIGNILLLAVNVIMFIYGLQLIELTKVSLMTVTRWPASAVFYFIPISALASSLALVGKLFGLYETGSVRNFISGQYDEMTVEED